MAIVDFLRRVVRLLGRVLVRRPASPVDTLLAATNIANFTTLYAVRVVATLGVPDLVSGGRDSVAELAGAVGADLDALGRVLRHLVDVGLFSAPAPGRVALTDVGRLLLADHPSRLHERFQLDGISRRLEASVAGLMHSVMTGGAAYAKASGVDVWTELAADTRLARSFDSEMERHIELIGPSLVRAYDWSSAAHLIDVGGGTGLLLAHVLRAHEHLRGTLVEVADAAGRAGSRLSDPDLAARSSVYEGSFFDPLPAGGDAYMLSWIIHDWPDAPAIRILDRCRDAVRPGGRILIVERPLLPDNPALSAGDLRVLAFVGGRERSVEDYSDLAAAAGLELDRADPLAAGFMLMAYRPAGDGDPASC